MLTYIRKNATKLGTLRILNIGKEKGIFSKRTTEAEVIE